MNSDEAKLLLGDDKAILALARNNPDPAEAIRAALAAVNSAPALVTQMHRGLAAIVADDSIKLENGMFIQAREFTPADAERLMRNTSAFLTSSENVGNMGRWLLGNIVTVLKDAGVDAESFIRATELAYNTIITSETTFRFFQAGRFPMPFSHHKEIAYANDLSREQKLSIASYASDNQLSLTSTRAIIRLMQAQVRDGQDIEPIEDLYAKIDIPTRAGKRFLAIAGTTSRIVDRVPSGREMEELDEVYEIRAIIKSRAVGGGAGDAAQPADQDGAPAEPDGAGDNA